MRKCLLAAQDALDVEKDEPFETVVLCRDFIGRLAWALLFPSIKQWRLPLFSQGPLKVI
jgi:hypothetical protein